MLEVLKQALEALETTWYHVGTFAPTDDAIELYDQARTSLRQAIAELESQEPVAWMKPDVLCDRACMYLCTKGFTQFPECANVPPQRTWQGLTDEDCRGMSAGDRLVAMWADRTLKEKNT